MVIKQARRQTEAALAAGYQIKWIVPDQKAMQELQSFLIRNGFENISVEYRPLG